MVAGKLTFLYTQFLENYEQTSKNLQSNVSQVKLSPRTEIQLFSAL